MLFDTFCYSVFGHSDMKGYITSVQAMGTANHIYNPFYQINASATEIESGPC